MPYWRLFYHIVWATKNRQPAIEEAFALSLHNCLAAKAGQLGALVHAVGGVEDHVHMAVSAPPTMALSEFIRQLKGNSAHFVNHEFTLPNRFGWQREYGVVSFDGKQLPKMVQYVKGQRQHHADRTTIPILERLTPDVEMRCGMPVSKPLARDD